MQQTVPRWCYVVEVRDSRSGILTRERFLFPADARERAERRRQEGFYRVEIREERVNAHGPPPRTQPGRFGGLQLGVN
jgi:hypothetical protein